MLYTKSYYKNPVVYITENGTSSPVLVSKIYLNILKKKVINIFPLIIIIIEFLVGVNELANKSLPLSDILDDGIRISYHHDHLLALRSAIRSAVITFRDLSEENKYKKKNT
jgi:hypothetical protein